MTHRRRTAIRAVFIVLVLLSLVTLAQGYVSHAQKTEELRSNPTDQQIERSVEGLTIVTTSERVTNGKRDNAIIAYSPEGEIVYYNDSLLVYNDVDPLKTGDSTVLYVGAEHLHRSKCHATTNCWLNVVETLNLTTGEVTRIYSRINPGGQNQWHDVDRIGDSRLLVADIAFDRVFIINTTSGVIEWAWDAQSDFRIRSGSGGVYPGDWTHLNDVELLEDGRVMVSLRNQDMVVFIDRQQGLQENWTLGADDKHSVLYEQHNPDYIPPERGGPSVLVADSENNRIVEYHRTESGEWVQTWEWTDPQLMWPRDADRLPNGNTLITDTNGGRVLEVNPQGEIVWSVKIRGAYDAERLGTGDESAGGYAVGAQHDSSAEGQSQVGESQAQVTGAQSRDRT